MSILNGLRAAWIKLSENKNKDNSDGDIVYSEDNELIEEKIDAMLNKLIKRDCSGKFIISDFVYDISNRQTRIYPKGEKNKHWKYKFIINKEDGSHYFELSINNKKVMSIDAKTTLKGELLKFNAMYVADMSDYLGNTGAKGTACIKVDCSKEGIIDFEDKIYALDLLNNNYSNDILEESIVSDHRFSLGKVRTLK